MDNSHDSGIAAHARQRQRWRGFGSSVTLGVVSTLVLLLGLTTSYGLAAVVIGVIGMLFSFPIAIFLLYGIIRLRHRD
jgi:hypothetical protein